MTSTTGRSYIQTEPAAESHNRRNQFGTNHSRARGGASVAAPSPKVALPASHPSAPEPLPHAGYRQTRAEDRTEGRRRQRATRAHHSSTPSLGAQESPPLFHSSTPLLLHSYTPPLHSFTPALSLVTPPPRGARALPPRLGRPPCPTPVMRPRPLRLGRVPRSLRWPGSGSRGRPEPGGPPHWPVAALGSPATL